MRESGALTRPPDIYRRAFRLTLPYWRKLSGVLVLSLLAGLPGQLWPLLLVPLLDDALLGGNFGLLLQLAALMVVMQVGGLVLTSYTGYRYVGLSARALFDLRLTVYRRLQQLSPRFFAGARTGDLLSRLNTDVSELQRTAGDLLLSLTQNVVGLLVALVLVLALAPALLVPALLVLPFAAITLTRLRTRVTDENRRLREAGASVGSALVESVLGMRQTVAFRQEEREAERFRGENDRFIDALLRARRTTYVASGIPASLVSIAGAAAFLYGGYQVIQGNLTLGTLGAAMTYQMRLFGPVQGLLGQYLGLRAARASFERVFELLDEPAGVEDPAHPVPASRPRGPLHIESVSLSYGREEKPVLDGASLMLPEGSLTVLVGPSGVGKTTLSDLILRRLDPDRGKRLLGRRGHPAALALRTAERDRGRGTGTLPLARADRREHPLRAARRDRGIRDRGGGPPRGARRFRRGSAGRSFHGRRGARPATLGRPAAADRHRPGGARRSGSHPAG